MEVTVVALLGQVVTVNCPVPLLCFYVELGVLGSFFCIAVLLKCSKTDLGKVPVFSWG